MEKLYLEPTALTPLINFDPEHGVMAIKGRSIPDSPDDFWYSIVNWFDNYLLSPHKLTVININLEYFNVTSSKRILALLYKLNDLVDTGNEVKVNWFYREGDEDMYEVGQDYAYMVKVPFEFKKIEESDLAIAI